MIAVWEKITCSFSFHKKKIPFTINKFGEVIFIHRQTRVMLGVS